MMETETERAYLKSDRDNGILRCLLSMLVVHDVKEFLQRERERVVSAIEVLRLLLPHHAEHVGRNRRCQQQQRRGDVLGVGPCAGHDQHDENEDEHYGDH